MEPSPLLPLSSTPFLSGYWDGILVFRTPRSSCAAWWISSMRNWRNLLLQRRGIWTPVTRRTSGRVTEALQRMSSSPVTPAVTGGKERARVGPQGAWAAAPWQRQSCWSRMKQGEGSQRKRGWRTESSPAAIGAATQSRWMKMQMLILRWCQLMAEPHLRCCQLPVLPAHVGHQVYLSSSWDISRKMCYHPPQALWCSAVANTLCDCSFSVFQKTLHPRFSSVPAFVHNCFCEDVYLVSQKGA